MFCNEPCPARTRSEGAAAWARRGRWCIRTSRTPRSAGTCTNRSRLKSDSPRSPSITSDEPVATPSDSLARVQQRQRNALRVDC
eukprot:2656476-Pyramimonas_sp.AAC.1